MNFKTFVFMILTFRRVDPIPKNIGLMLSDGLPFNVDNLTIPYGKWRKESIKAYGNAIVPLIAVKIFEMINKIEGYEQQTTL